jgi:hypothetical protein
MPAVVICDVSQIKDPKYSHNMKYRAVRKIHALCKMAEAPTDLLNYVYDPCCPLPTGNDARNHVISKGPCQPKDHNFPVDNRNRRFQVSWYEKFDWLEYSKSLDKAFCFYCRVFNAQVR